MDFVKNYMISAISEASKKLRLNSEKIELLNKLEEWIAARENLQADIAAMKRITETSKLAIRLQDINNYLQFESIDYKKLSDKFKEHSTFLVTDLDYLLFSVNLFTFQKILARIEKIKATPVDKSGNTLKIELDLNEDLTSIPPKIIKPKRSLKIDSKGDEPELPLFEHPVSEKKKTDFLKSERDFLYAPIKDLEELLRRMKKEDFRSSEVFRFSDVFDERMLFCKKNGVDELVQPYANIANCLRLIYNKEVTVSQDILDYFRASMIVIVTRIRGLEHDITEYILRNQLFTESLKVYKKD